MNVFGNYSKYYNLFYQDKNYAGEAEYVHRLIQRYASGAKSIIELGCGTGKHADLLSQKGYTIDGVDMSQTMLLEAKNKYPHIHFHHGDIRQIRLAKKTDVVISLFHVMSYQQTNEDLEKAFSTAKVHLHNGGIFIFDCWYGPAVLTDRPVVRIKHLKDESFSVTRIAEPVIYPNENIVDVNYHLFIKDKATDEVEELKETHTMRYLFKPEIEEMMKVAGFEMLTCEEWMSGKDLGFDTWNACFVVKS